MGILVPQVPEAACITGGPVTGKTAELARRACELSQAGQRVLVMCAAPQAARSLSGRLVAASACDVEVMTALEVAASVLDDPAVQRRHGGPLRVLDAFEEAVLFEDVKTCGGKRGRLRELLLFLERGWSDLSDDDPAWIQTAEERLVLNLMQECLRFSGGVLQVQAAGMAVRELLADADVRERHARPHVLVDDYGLLGRASQVLANLLATCSIAVAADPAATLPVGDAYPYAEGVAEFLQANPHAKRLELTACARPEAMVRALGALRADVGCEVQLERALADGSACASLEQGIFTIMEPGIVEELGRVADEVRHALDVGVSPGRVFVAGTNAAWRANACRALASCGVPVRMAARRTKKVRFETCGAGARQVAADRALARLAQDQNDSLAWRTWCGLSDALANSAAMTQLRSVGEGEAQGMRLASVLALLDAGELEGVDAADARFAGVLSAYREGKRCLAELAASGKGAGELPVRPAGRSASKGVSPDVAVAPGLSAASSSSADTVPASSAEEVPQVTVGAPEDLFGREADVVVFGGFVNGLIPSRDYFDPTVLVGAARERAHRADVEKAVLAVAAAGKRLVLTGFTSCGLETAERLKLRIARIRLKDGVRMAQIEPSILLETMA